MRRAAFAVFCPLLVAGLASCSSGEAEVPDPDTYESVTVPAKGDLRTEDEIVDSNVVVTNEEYDEGVYEAVVTIKAKTATTDPDSNRHWFSGRIILTGGSSVECQEFKAWIWGDFGVYEDIGIPCEKRVHLADVVRFEID